MVGIQFTVRRRPCNEACNDNWIEIDIPRNIQAPDIVREISEKIAQCISMTLVSGTREGLAVLDHRDGETTITLRISTVIGEHAKLIPAEPREGYNRLWVYVHHTEHESFNRPPTPWEVR